MSFDLTKNMPQSIKSNLQEAKSRIEALEALAVSLDSDIVNDLTTGGTDKVLSAEQGKTLKGLIDGINTILQSDDVNLDTVQEVVDFLKQIQTELNSILVDNLTTNDSTKALTAKQGKVLKDALDALTTVVNDLTTDDVAEGSNQYFTDARAKAAAVVNSSAGSETDQAMSVAANKSYIASQISAVAKKYVKKSATGSIAANEQNIYCNITSANITLTLPSVGSSEDGESHLIMNNSTSTKNVIVAASDSDTVEGGANVTILPGEYIEFIYEHSATDWFAKQ